LLAVLGVVFELFVVEKQLLACSEHKIGATVGAFQNSIIEIHGRLPCNREHFPIRPCPLKRRVLVGGIPVLFLDTQQGPGPRSETSGTTVFPRIRWGGKNEKAER
jgi:hypothetical protein